MFALWGIYVCKQLEGVYLKGAYLWELCTHTIPKPATHVHSTCAIGGGTRGGAPGARLPPPFKLSGIVTFLTIPRRWNTCSDGSAIPEHGKRHSKNTSSPNINLSTNMTSETISEHLILNWGTIHPDFPSMCVLMHACPPPNFKYLPPPMCGYSQ